MKLIWKILIPILVIVIAFDVILIVQNISGRTSLLRQKNAHDLEKDYQTICTYFELQGKKLLGLATQISNDTDIQQAFASADCQVLNEIINPSYQHLKKQGLITDLEFYKPPAQIYLVPEKPELNGQDVSVSRKSIATMNRESKPIVGIEASATALSIRAIVPINSAEQYIGALDLSIALDQKLLEDVRKLIEGDVSIFVPEERKKLMREIKFQKLAPEGFLTYSSSAENLLSINPTFYKNVVRTGEKTIIDVDHDDHTFDVLFAPIYDVRGDIIAVLEMRRIKDVFLTEISESRNFGIIYGIFVLLISSLAIWQIVSYFITKPISHITAVADAISLGDFTTKISINSRDEIGDLAQSIERMQTSLKGAIERLKKRK